jgi:type I restriction enzyme R subunit
MTRWRRTRARVKSWASPHCGYATELVASIKRSVLVDWMHREATRARMRVLVKRLLRKYGYPPDLQDAAVQKVLQQAEALSAEWTA